MSIKNFSTMEIKFLKVVSFVTSREVSRSKILVDGSWKYLTDPAAPIIYDLAFLLNASLEIIPTTNATESLSNGTLGGLGGMILNGEADFGGDASMFEPQWAEKGLSLLHLNHAERLYVFFKQPDSLIDRGLLLKPFTWQIWLSILIMWIAIMSTVHFLRVVKREEESWENGCSFLDIMLWAIASICGRSYDLRPCDGFGLKSLTICGFQFGMIILSIYSGFIVSSLTYKTVPIKSFRDLVKYGYSITAKPTLSFNVFVEDPIEAHILWEMSEKNFKSPVDALRKIYDGYTPKTAYFVVHGWFHRLSEILGLSNVEMCKVSQISTVTKYPLPMFVKKHCKLKEILNQKILLVMQTGLNDRYLRQSAKIVIPRCDPPKHIPEALSVSNFRGVFLLMVFGYALTLVVLSIEVTIRNKDKNVISFYYNS